MGGKLRQFGLGAVLALGLVCVGIQVAYAAEAENVAPGSTITLGGSASGASVLCDGRYTTRAQFEDGGTVTLVSMEGIEALYLMFDSPPQSWTLETSGGSRVCGEERYLHQFEPLDRPQNAVTIRFEGPAVLCEVYAFSQGELPEFVQDWKAPCERADLLLLPTHADDEHLYFGGTMPTYTARGYAVQVAYMVNHNGEPYRPHELLNGLWTVGIRNYPVIPRFPDMYSDSLEHARTIYDEAEILAYQIELIRRFKPSVIVGHDIDGEYGHGAHRLNAATLQQAVEAAADPQANPESAAKYGVWDTPKTYLHLWQEGALVMNWDEPLEDFGGATAFEMAVEGFACHRSQQTYFQVEQSGPYDCRKFGLYRSTVGEDVEKDDFFENIEPAAEEPELPPESEGGLSVPESRPPEPPEPSSPEKPEDAAERAFPWAAAAAAGMVAVLLAGAAAAAFLRKKR